MGLTPEDLAQLPKIQLQSPLATVGAFLYLIRHRFDPQFNLQWKYSEETTLTDIVIEAQFNPNTEVRDSRPAIYVDRDQVTYGKVSVGNLDQSQPKTLQRDLTHFISVGQMDMVIDCVSPSRGESMQLADVVQTYIESSKYIIMSVFGFRDLSPIVMGRTQAFAKQSDLHQTSLNFRVEYESRWATVHAYPVLRGLGLKLAETSKGVNSLLAEVYLNSSR